MGGPGRKRGRKESSELGTGAFRNRRFLASLGWRRARSSQSCRGLDNPSVHKNRRHLWVEPLAVARALQKAKGPLAGPLSAPETNVARWCRGNLLYTVGVGCTAPLAPLPPHPPSCPCGYAYMLGCSAQEEVITRKGERSLSAGAGASGARRRPRGVVVGWCGRVKQACSTWRAGQTCLLRVAASWGGRMWRQRATGSQSQARRTGGGQVHAPTACELGGTGCCVSSEGAAGLTGSWPRLLR